jgi:hypothetical protein
MASFNEALANVIKIRGFIGIYLKVPTLNAKQKAALATNLAQLDKNLATLATFATPVADPPFVAPVAAVLADPVPNFGERPEMSSGLYGEWVAAWWAKHFGGLASVNYGTIVEQATAEGALAQVCAAGKIGSPDGPVPDLGDWSLFTALVSTQDDAGITHRVFHMGKLVGTQEGGDGLDFAKTLGFNW